jgi:TolA-binding protein
VAGPFDVHVTGTTFTLAWDAPSQAIDLTLIEGAVEVESPLGASHIVVRGGQRFRASLIAGTMQLESADEAQAPQRVSASSEPVHAAAAPQPAAAAVSKPHPAARRASSSDWTELVRAGSFEAVIDAANGIGLAPTLARGSADDVRALADAARYTERHALALRALMVLRGRFPNSHQAAAAAFLLGRTYEGSGDQQHALRYYTRYLRESASGGFAAEALAGQIRTTAALSGAEAARPLADTYLERYPDGVFAKTAQRYAGAR